MKILVSPQVHHNEQEIQHSRGDLNFSKTIEPKKHINFGNRLMLLARKLKNHRNGQNS